ncbi:MAG: alpha/beta hydrolase [Bacteroidota bacterium]
MKTKICSTIEVCGKEIYYEFINPDLLKPGYTLLVFLHEGLGSVQQWKDFPEFIGNTVACPVLVYDRYGYGKSQAFSEPRTKEYLKDEAFLFLPEMLKQLKITENIILVGHSDGGSIALLYASRFREKVRGVITEADHLFCEEETISGIKNIVKEFELGKLKYRLRKFHGDKTDLMFYGWSHVWLNPKNRRWNIEKYLSSITCPVLAIQGENDCYGTEKQLVSKIRRIKSPLDVMFINDCGHVPHFEAEIEVKKKMIEFICIYITKMIYTHKKLKK